MTTHTMRSIIDLVETSGRSAEPYIEAHRSDTIVWIDMMVVPKEMRGKGLGRAFYEKWEAELPKDIEMIRLMAADTGSGSGLSNGFWDAMGFNYQYEGDELDYETSQYMWKGVNGHPTPPTVRVDGENEED